MFRQLSNGHMKNDQIRTGLPDDPPASPTAGEPTAAKPPENDLGTKIRDVQNRTYATWFLEKLKFPLVLTAGMLIESIRHTGDSTLINTQHELNQANRDREALLLHNRFLVDQLQLERQKVEQLQNVGAQKPQKELHDLRRKQ